MSGGAFDYIHFQNRADILGAMVPLLADLRAVDAVDAADAILAWLGGAGGDEWPAGLADVAAELDRWRCGDSVEADFRAALARWRHATTRLDSRDAPR